MNYYILIYGLPIITILITISAEIFINFAYNKYKKKENKRKITGYDAAREILNKNGLEDIEIEKVGGYLSDHYDPSNKVVRLSRDNYDGTSIASVCVACHECGHAIQDKENYTFMRIREKIIPVVNFTSKAGYIAILLGFLLSYRSVLWIGIISEIMILLFQLLTLPVEIDASRRALKEIDYAHFFNSEELKQGKIVLAAAANTYIASLATVMVELLRMIILLGQNDDN